jgi:prepilin-type N-terminal cleavage/methylation domain-containing protein
MTNNSSTMSRQSKGFTLTELLIAIAIFVVMLAMAMPVFRTLTGSRSIEQGTNIISAKLGHVRNQAMGLEQYGGVMFYLDSDSDRIAMVTLVQSSIEPAFYYPPPGPFVPVPDVWFDIDPTVDPVLLPQGIGLQTMVNAPLGGAGQRLGNGYIGFGAPFAPGVNHRMGGCIIFGPDGRLFTGTPGVALRSGTTTTAIKKFMFGTDLDFPPASLPFDGLNWASTAIAMCLFESEPYATQFGGVAAGGTDAWADPQSSYTANERAKENWLDANATPLLINRYNGTLIKGE